MSRGGVQPPEGRNQSDRGLDRVKFSGDSKINIKFFVIRYTNSICSTRGSIHLQFIKPSFRAIQINFA